MDTFLPRDSPPWAKKLEREFERILLFLIDDQARETRAETAREVAVQFEREHGRPLSAYASKWQEYWITDPDKAISTFRDENLKYLANMYVPSGMPPSASPELQRLFNVVRAYRDGLIGANVAPHLPDTPGMVSANAIGSFQWAQTTGGEEHQDAVAAGEKWLNRLRKRIARAANDDSYRHCIAPDEIAVFRCLISMLPARAGRPRRSPKLSRMCPD